MVIVALDARACRGLCELQRQRAPDALRVVMMWYKHALRAACCMCSVYAARLRVEQAVEDGRVNKHHLRRWHVGGD